MFVILRLFDKELQSLRVEWLQSVRRSGVGRGSYYKILEVPKIQGDITVINLCTLSIHQRAWLLGTSTFLILPLSISLESLLGVLLVLGSHILSCPLTSGDTEQLSSFMVSSNLFPCKHACSRVYKTFQSGVKERAFSLTPVIPKSCALQL